CALKEIWFRKRHEPKLLRPKNQFDFIHDKTFSDLALSLSFPNRFSPWPDFEIDKSIFGNQLTCLMLAHVLDDYPKGLDPDLDVLRIEKPFHYFFGRFDVVSLVALNKQDKHDQFLRRASTNGRQSTWNSLMKITSKLQGSFCPYFSFPEFSMHFNSFVSDSSLFDIGTLDLRTNPFEEGGNDRTRSTDQHMEPNQPGDQNNLKISTEVHVFHHTDRTLYWAVPHASGWELWLEPWPDDRFDRTRFCIHHTVFHFMKNSRDEIAFGRTNPEIGHRYSILDCTVRTARATGLELLQNSRPDDRIFQTEYRLSRPVLHSKKNGRDRFQFDRMDFKLGRATSFPASLDCPDRVLVLSAGHAEGYLQVSILLLLDRCVTSGNDRSL
ncbi:unnamed protein product, partial [Brassica rapa]